MKLVSSFSALCGFELPEDTGPLSTTIIQYFNPKHGFL